MSQTSVQANIYGSPRETKTRNAINRTGATLSRGDLVQLDLGASATETVAFTSFVPGTNADTTHIFSSVIPAATAQLGKAGIWLVALETIADNAVGRFGLQGVFDVECVGGGAVAINTAVIPTNAATYVSATADGSCNVGIALEAGPTGSAPATIKVLFNGDVQNTNGG